MHASRKGKSVLVVEDDRNTAALISLYLEKEGFTAHQAHDGATAVRLAGQDDYSLIILDLMLPEMDGWEVCRTVRRLSDVPIIMLTARAEEVDCVSGLTMGADDFITKPFSPRELAARIRAVLRRTETGRQETSRLVFGRLSMDKELRQSFLDGRPLSLTPHEYRLLEAFMSRPGRVWTRRELLGRLYPEDETEVVERVVDVHVGKLRQKIEKDTQRPEYILTVRGLGYKFQEQPRI